MNLNLFTVCNQAGSWCVKRFAVWDYRTYQLFSILTQEKELLMRFTYIEINNRETRHVRILPVAVIFRLPTCKTI